MLTGRWALAIVAAATLAACSPSMAASQATVSRDATTASSPPAAAAQATPVEAQELTASGPVTFAVVGDSLSLGNSPDFDGGVAGNLSWVYWAQGDDATFVGGTAEVGAASWSQARRAVPIDADVLVMALGTNDMSADASFAATAEALTQIAATVGAPRVLVLSVPPRRYEGEPSTVEFNGWLRGLAAEHDWQFVDAARVVRDGDTWADGMTGDGIHYSNEAIPLVGAYVGFALRAGG